MSSTEEEDDYARLMRLLEEEEDGGDDGANVDQEPVKSIVSQLDTSDQDIFQMLETSCSENTSPPPPTDGGNEWSTHHDTLARDRSRTESIPDGIGLEWEGSDRSVPSRNHSLEYEQEQKQDKNNTNEDEHKNVDEDDDTDEQQELVWTDAVEDYPSLLTSEGLEELNGPRFLSLGSSSFDFFLGLRKIHLALQDQAVTYFLRPDVTADSVFSLIEQIMLSFGSKCLEPLPSHTHRELLFQPTHPESSCWQDIRVYLGVNATKRRVLVVVLKPAQAVSRGLLSSGLGLAASWGGGLGLGGLGSVGSGEGRTSEGFATFVNDLEACFTQSLQEEQLTLGHMLKQLPGAEAGPLAALSTLAERHTQTLEPPSPLPPPSSSPPPLPPLDSLLDPYFIRDLQEAFLHEVQTRMERLTVSQLATVATLEKQCARLMTLLRPFYTRCGLPTLTPPGKTPAFIQFINEGRVKLGKQEQGSEAISSSERTSSAVSSAAVTSSSSHLSIQQATLDNSKLLLLRARRSFLRDQREGHSNHGATPGSSSSFKVSISLSAKHGIEVQGVLHLLYDQLRSLCEEYGEEYACTLRALVAARTQDVQKFQVQLVQTLVTREIRSAEDKELWRGFKAQFRVASATDPFLVDFKATMSSMLTDTGVSSAAGGTMSNNNRSGTLYITQRDLYFTSSHLLLGGMQKILPIRLLTSVTTTDATLLSNGSLAVVDSGGNTTTFWISSSGGGDNYSSRVADLLHLLMRMEGWTKDISADAEITPVTSTRAEVAATSTSKTLSASSVRPSSGKSTDKDDTVNFKSKSCTNPDSSHEPAATHAAISQDLLSLTMEPTSQEPDSLLLPQITDSFEESIEAAVARSLKMSSASSSFSSSSSTSSSSKSDPFASLTTDMLEKNSTKTDTANIYSITKSTSTSGDGRSSSSTNFSPPPLPPPRPENKMALGIQAFLDQQRQQSTKK